MISMRSIFAQTVHEIAAVDESVVVLVGDISHGILQPMAQQFPNRYYNVGICEPAIVNIASGLSKVGLNPVVHTIAPFLIERSFEQLKLDFEYEGQSVNLVSVGGAFDYAQLGCTHHCYDDIALLRQLPSSRIFVPGTGLEFKSMFQEFYSCPGINYFRLSELQNKLNFDTNEGVMHVEIGSDVTLVALGTRLDAALDSASRLRGSVESDVFYVNRVRPFSHDVIKDSVLKTGALVVVEEHSVTGGLQDTLLQSLAGIPFLYEGLGIRDFIHAYGSHEELSEIAGIGREDIVAALLNVTKRDH